MTTHELGTTPEGVVHLVDVQMRVSLALIAALQFRSWQTNFPDSRPELNTELDEVISDLAGIEKTLHQMEAN